MVRVEFGPNVCSTVGALNVYTSHALNLTNVRLLDYNEEDQTLELSPTPGVYRIDDVNFVVKDVQTIHALDSRMAREFNGYIEADNLDFIKKFINNAIKFSEEQRSMNENTDTIKIFQNNFIWDTENIIKKRSIDSVQLPKKILENFLKDIKTFFLESVKEKYSKLEIPHNRVYMFYGPPGTGKTTLIHAIASHVNMNIASIEFDSEMSDKQFKRCLRRVPHNSIICIEDIDCLFEDRKSNDSFKNGVTFSGILNAIDGVSKLENTIMIITTNHIGRLDDALKRRIDYFVKFDYSTKAQIQEQFSRFFPESASEFDKFWQVAKNVKLTPNILQKFFTKYLMCDDIISVSEKDLGAFATGEHSLEENKSMYT